IETHYPQFKLIRLDKNRGNSGARNVGLQVAKGELIAFLDHDDQWLPSYLETQVKQLEDEPGAVATYCDYYAVKLDGSRTYRNLKPKEIYTDFTYYLLRWNIIESLSLILIKSHILQEIGFFNEDLKICSDMELYLRLSQKGNIIHIPQPLILKYLHDQNLSSDYWLWAKDELNLLNLFFARKESQPYLHLEHEIKSYALLKILRNTWPEHHNWFFALVMITQSFVLAPRYRLKLLLSRIKKAI
ncbi:MAG: glycosyltransferase family 2 protein, partial [Microcystaceae cyanobacterium]